MPSPWNTSPAPLRSMRASFANEISTGSSCCSVLCSYASDPVLFVQCICFRSIIPFVHTKPVDLNLLQTFHAVHVTGNVSRAAERLGVSQPTVSHALQRLRRIHGDPLFVRTQGGMAPTAKAQRLAKAVEHALNTLDVALRETETYEPARSDRTFRLHLTDIG